MMMSCDDTGTSGVRRFEVFTGAGCRRRWPTDVKVSIVAESYSGQETVSAVARRHGLAPSQLFTWRRQMRQRLKDPELASSTPSFVPAVIDPIPVPAPPTARHVRGGHRGKAAVELEIDGVFVKIGRRANAKVITAVIAALRAPQ
jgi:transposase